MLPPTSGMQSKGTIDVTIQILECFNILIALSFLILFLRRLLQLRHLSYTNAYTAQYPYRTKLFLPLAFILASLCLLIYDLVRREYGPNVLDYFLEGGGGECINSLILVLHAAVLKQELAKEQHYTRLHQRYIIWLAIVSACRVGFTAYSLIEEGGEVVSLVCSGVLLGLSGGMLAVWLRAGLPDFVDSRQIDEHAVIRSLTSGLLSRSLLEAESGGSSELGNGRQVFATVMVERGLIRIIMEALVEDEDVLGSIEREEQRSSNRFETESRRSNNIDSNRFQTESHRSNNIDSNRDRRYNTDRNGHNRHTSSNKKNKREHL